ncbi:MAG TPA: sugar ABC transporter permease [Ruminococcaceae bacterium]|nr:sugar ABC transporter permease [Oscillospiraceae bacterium]HCM22745.1 sugar ABC transporter permease [Oscillospiraceae bacterium]
MGKSSARDRDQRIAALVFIAPAAILLILFLIVPVLSSVKYSFTDYNILRPDRIHFCGFSNFAELFRDPDFHQAIWHTVYFTLLVVPIQCLLALVLALFVSSRRRGVSVFRAAYFSPMVTSMVVVAILWTVLYNPDPNTGLINAFLVKIGAKPQGFLNDPKMAMNSIIFMSAWQAAGYQMMIFLAGLQAIPSEQYEAASIDGAGTWKQLIYITLPGLRNVTKYVVIITTIQAMKLFTQPYVMTKGGPQNTTMTQVYYIYEQGFQERNFGYACAAAVVFLLIVILMSLLLKRIIKAS